MKNGKRILVVDEESNFRFSAKVALRKAGYEVSGARDGKEALSKSLEARSRGEMFSLLLVDVRLQALTRLEILEALKRHAIEIPVVAITDFNNKAILDDLMRRGCAGYIEKPFEPQELVERVDEFLEGKPTKEAPL